MVNVLVAHGCVLRWQDQRHLLEGLDGAQPKTPLKNGGQEVKQRLWDLRLFGGVSYDAWSKNG